MNKLPFQEMLRRIHDSGLSWKGIGKALNCKDDTVNHYALNGGNGIFLSYERGVWILRVHKVLCPEAHKKIEVMIEAYEKANKPTIPPRSIFPETERR